MKSRLHIHDELESELYLLGANDRRELQERIEELLRYVEHSAQPMPSDMALTAGLAAQDGLERAAVVATSIEDLAAKLRILLRRMIDGKGRIVESRGVYLGTDLCPAPGRLVFIFPGEGSQYPDMLRDLCLNFPACRSAFDDADTACAAAAGSILPSQWIFPTGEQPESEVARGFDMANAVQAVLAADTAMLRLFAQIGIAPDAVAGAGIGEIAALECAGVFDFQSRFDRIDALREGYELLRQLSNHPGIPVCASLSISGLLEKNLSKCLSPFGKDVLVTRDHGTDHFGLCVRHQELAEQVMRTVTQAGGNVRALPLPQPYHTPWLEPALPALKTFFGKLISTSPQVPVYSCMMAAPHAGTLENWAANAAMQWVKPVRFGATIRRLYDDGFRVFVEIGARGSLAAGINSVLQDKPHLAVAANRGHRSGGLQLHHALAALFTHGQRIDVKQLHANRGSNVVDLRKPRAARRGRGDRFALDLDAPTLRHAKIPPGLVAPPAPTPVGLREVMTPDRGKQDGDEGGADFPLLLDADVLVETPGERIDLGLSLSITDHPFLADSALGTHPVALADRTLRGLPVLPLGMLAEMLAEAARRLAPDLFVVGLDKLDYARWLTIDGGDRAVRISATRLPAANSGGMTVAVVMHERRESQADNGDCVASMRVRLAEEYPEPVSPRSLALKGPVPLDWKGQDLYPARLHHGPQLQNLFEVSQWGENGLLASWVTLPRGSLLRRVANPRFSLDPVLLEALGAALAAWQAREPHDGHFHLPRAFETLAFYAPPLKEWSRGTLTLLPLTDHVTDGTMVADADLLDSDGHLLAQATGWRNRVFDLGTAVHRLILHPADGYLSRSLPEDALPALPKEVVCCAAPRADDPLFTSDNELWLRATACLTLSLSERLKWREMGGAVARRTEWLLGRIAAKDAVRRCLQSRYGRKWAAADIRVETDEAGKPRPQGEWRRYCGARMDISITHTADRIVAAVAPNDSLGIDIERSERAISDEFAAAAFCTTEQEIAAETGEGSQALIRFWCAKEALAKALGTGLRFGAGDLKVRGFERQNGRVDIEPTRLWLQAFPALKGAVVPVHTCVFEKLVLAVCVMEPSLPGEIQPP